MTGDTAWLEKKDWKDFCEYEESLNLAVVNQRLAVLCTYPLAACGAAEILDVAGTHQFAVTRRRGSWDVIETAGHKQAKAEIKRLNEELAACGPPVLRGGAQLFSSRCLLRLRRTHNLSICAGWSLVSELARPLLLC